MMIFKDVASVVQRRYNVSMALANQTAMQILRDKGSFKDEAELNTYLEELEQLGK